MLKPMITDFFPGGCYYLVGIDGKANVYNLFLGIDVIT